MRNKITVSDYCSDWVIKDKYVDPKPTLGYLDVKEVIGYYSSLEVDAVELGDTYWCDYDPKDVKRICEDAGFPIYSYNIFSDFALPDEYRKTSVEQVRRLLDRTAALGAGKALIFPLTLKMNIDMDTQRSWLVEGLREGAEYAKSIGIKLCIENWDDPIGRPLMGSISQIIGLYKDVDSEGLALIYDDGATPFVKDDPIAMLREIAPYVEHIHIKNCRKVHPYEKIERSRADDEGQRFTGTLLSEGMIDIPKVLEEVKKIDYSGYISIEYQGMDFPVHALRKNIEYYNELTKEW